MTTGEAEQVTSPSSDWILHESYRDALRIIRCQMLFFTLRGTTLFLGWWWHWREPVVTAVPISIFLMRDLFLVISILAKTSCRVRKVETCRRGKGRKNLTAVSSKWIGFLCVGMRARFAKDLRRTLHLCSKLWPPKGLLHYCWALSAPDTPYKGCPSYYVCWQQQWCMGRRDKCLTWGCSRNLIGNKIGFDRKYI